MAVTRALIRDLHVLCPDCGTQVERMTWAVGWKAFVLGMGTYVGGGDEEPPLAARDVQGWEPGNVRSVEPCGHSWPYGSDGYVLLEAAQAVGSVVGAALPDADMSALLPVPWTAHPVVVVDRDDVARAWATWDPDTGLVTATLAARDAVAP